METLSYSLTEYLEKQSTEMLKQLLFPHLRDEDQIYYGPVIRDIIRIINKRHTPYLNLSEEEQKEQDRRFDKFLKEAGF